MKRHSLRFSSGSRNGLRYLSISSLLCAQAKSPPAKDKAESNQNPPDKQQKKERAIVHQVACHIAALERIREANRRREMALLDATPERQFYGDIIIDSRNDAIDTATEISNSNANHQHLVFFVDGSRITKPKKKSRSSVPGTTNLVTRLGAAVVYKSSKNDQRWQERYFTLPSGKCSTLAELSGIAEGLAVATTETLLLRGQNSISPGSMAPNYKVTIFTDSTGALTQINKLRKKSALTDARLRGDPIVCKIITRSQYLRRIGVQLELRWVKSHSKVEGHTRADKAAQYAAKNQDIGISLNEGLRLIEIEAASSTTNKQSQNKIYLGRKRDDKVNRNEPKSAVTSKDDEIS